MGLRDGLDVGAAEGEVLVGDAEGEAVGAAVGEAVVHPVLHVNRVLEDVYSCGRRAMAGDDV